jgi:hypothetical protein
VILASLIGAVLLLCGVLADRLERLERIHSLPPLTPLPRALAVPTAWRRRAR